MIRLATHDDIPALIECGRRFHAEAGVLDEVGATFSPERLRATLTDLIGKESACVVVAEKGGAVVGGAAALAYPSFFSDTLSAQELFWWIDPLHRGATTALRMLWMLEQWAGAVGCKTLTMVAIAIPDSPASKIYLRQGFKVLEAHFVKEL